jgi:hypothetical protein
VRHFSSLKSTGLKLAFSNFKNFIKVGPKESERMFLMDDFVGRTLSLAAQVGILSFVCDCTSHSIPVTHQPIPSASLKYV